MPPGHRVASASHEGRQRSCNSLQTFKAACVRRDRNLCRTWRLHLDPEGVGKVSYPKFVRFAQTMSTTDVKELWSALGLQLAEYMTLRSWDPASFKCLMELREICRKQHGSLEAALKADMDKTGSHTVTYQELAQFCRDRDFNCNPVALFESLDLEHKGYVAFGDFHILATLDGTTMTWLAQPPRKSGLRGVISPPLGILGGPPQLQLPYLKGQAEERQNERAGNPAVGTKQKTVAAVSRRHLILLAAATPRLDEEPRCHCPLCCCDSRAHLRCIPCAHTEASGSEQKQ